MYCPSLVIDEQYDVICMYMALKDLANLIKTFNTLKNGIYNWWYNVFAIYPNSSRRGLGYKFISLVNLLILYARGLVRLSIHKPVDEFQTKFGDGFWIRFVLKK